MCAKPLHSLWQYGLLPAQLFCPWHSPGKNIAVGCHPLLQGIFQTQGFSSCLFCLLQWQAGCLQLVLLQGDRWWHLFFHYIHSWWDIDRNFVKEFLKLPSAIPQFSLGLFIFVFFALYNVPTQHLNSYRSLLRRDSSKLKWVLRIFIPTRNIFPRTSHNQTMNLLYFWTIYILFFHL